MSMSLTPKLTEVAQLVSITVNQFGDRVYSTSQDTNCLYRDISRMTQGGNRESVDYDGLLWFDADDATNPRVGNIYFLPAENTYVKVDEVVRAKDLLGSSHPIRFIKCGVTKQRQVS